jgi:hypothetical protein
MESPQGANQPFTLLADSPGRSNVRVKELDPDITATYLQEDEASMPNTDQFQTFQFMK